VRAESLTPEHSTSHHQGTGQHGSGRQVAVLMSGAELARHVQPVLSAAGYLVEYCSDASFPHDQWRERHPVVFLLEFGVSHAETVALCRSLRSDHVFAKAAIVLLAERPTETDRVMGLDAGADAYLAMPFAGRELLAIVKAVRRSYESRADRERLSVGDIEVDVRGMFVKVSGEPVLLSITEFRLLEFLCRNLGRAISRDQLVQIVSKNARAGRRAVDVYMRRLRKKIERDPAQPRYLKTVRGIGYRLDSGTGR
jgi:DNA-binding response OmpR family regulator